MKIEGLLQDQTGQDHGEKRCNVGQVGDPGCVAAVDGETPDEISEGADDDPHPQNTSGLKGGDMQKGTGEEAPDAGDDCCGGEIEKHGRLLIVVVFLIQRTEQAVAHRSASSCAISL